MEFNLITASKEDCFVAALLAMTKLLHNDTWARLYTQAADFEPYYDAWEVVHKSSPTCVHQHNLGLSEKNSFQHSVCFSYIQDVLVPYTLNVCSSYIIMY